MKYYSTQRPITPGTYPTRIKAAEIKNYDEKTYCKEIEREVWGYIDTDEELTESEVKQYELVSEERKWYPVAIASAKRGGGLKATAGKSGEAIIGIKRPKDKLFEDEKREYKCRYYNSLAEAERVCDILNSIEITTERVRGSVTQGECGVIINDVRIGNFKDHIVLVPKGASKEDYYGEDIGGWMSDESDAGFTLGFIWHPLDYVYHYDKMICEKLGITKEEWI